jgi:hypothetical protein
MSFENIQRSILPAKTNSLAPRQGLVFDGTAGATGTAVTIGTADLTFSQWVRVPSTVSETRGLFLFSPAGSIGATSLLGYVDSDATLNIHITGATSGDRTKQTLSGFVTSYAGKWVNILFTRVGSTWTGYINGVATTFSASTSGTAPTWAGSISGAVVNFGSLGSSGAIYNDAISAINIYNRALSASEVVALYEAGAPSGADYNSASSTLLNTSTALNTYATAFTTFTGASATGFTGSDSTANKAARVRFPLSGTLVSGRRYRIKVTSQFTAMSFVQMWQSDSSYTGTSSIGYLSGNSTQEFTFTAAANVSSIMLNCATDNSAGTHTAVISGFAVDTPGLLLAPDAAQPGGGLVWYDTSGNGANITLPSSGVSWNVPSSSYWGGTLNLAGSTNYLKISTTGTPTSGTAALQLSFNGTNSRGIRLTNVDTGGRTYDIIAGGGGDAASFGLYDDTSAAYRLFIPSTGNVLIGKSTPDTGEKLQVSGDAAFSGQATVTGANGVVVNKSGGGLSIITLGDGTSGGYCRLNMRNGPSKYGWCIGAQDITDNALTITPSTAVGGTTFTTPILTLAQSGNATFGGNLTVSGTDYNYVGGNRFFRGFTNYNVLYTGATELSINNQADGANLASFKNNGNFLIGTTTDGGQKLQVSGTANIGNPFSTSTDDSLILHGKAVFDGSGNYGDYGSIVLSSSSSFTASARRYLITNAYLATDFAIIRSTNATTTPTIGTNGVVSSGTVDFRISESGNATFAGQITASGISHKLGSGGTGSANALLTIDGSSASSYGSYIVLQRNSTNKWQFGTYSGINGGTSDDFLLYNPTAANEALKIAAATSNATFAGTVTLPNDKAIYFKEVGGTAQRFALNSGDVIYIEPDQLHKISIGGSGVTNVGVGGIGVAGNSVFGGNLTVSGTGTSTFGGTIRAGAGSGETLTAGSLDTAADIGIKSTQGIVQGNARIVTFTSGNTALSGNLTVSGTGTSSFSGNVTVTGTGANYDAIDTGSFVKFGNNQTSANLQVGSKSGAGAILQGAAASSVSFPLIAQPYGGNFLIGTTTDSSLAKLQVAGDLHLNASDPTMTWNANTLILRSSTDSIGVVSIRRNLTSPYYSPRFEIQNSANTVTVDIDGSGDARLSGNLNLASGAPNADVTNWGLTPKFYTFSSGTEVSWISLRGRADAQGANIALLKSRATDGTANTAVQSGDELGNIFFVGADGASFIGSALIRAKAVGTIASTRVGGQLEFYTATDAAPSVSTVALTINNAQKAYFANNVIAASAGSAGIGFEATAGIGGDHRFSLTRYDTNSAGSVLLSAFGGIDFMYNATTTLTSGTIGARLDTSGNFKFSGNIGIGGTAPTTSGTGITFPATQSASSNANTLDDYEEGTWTPTFQGSTTNPTVTYAVQTGWYTKIGRQVTVVFELGTSANTGGVGTLIIGGLPFTQNNTVRSYSAIATYNIDNALTNPLQIFAEGVTNNTVLYLLSTSDNSNWTGITWTNATSSAVYAQASFTYFV